jgi:hypothetical protein
MTNKHTPAPWTVKGKEFIHDADHREIVYVLGYGKMGGLTDSEHEANAKLIAAAPDLLDALIDIIDDFDNYGGDDTGFPHIAKARAVIAKATGEN